MTGFITGVFPSPPAPLVVNVPIFCGSDTTQLSTLGYVYTFQGPLGTIPPLIYTLPKTGRYYIRAACSGFYRYSYRIQTRILTPLGGGAARDHRDAVLVRSQDGGDTWSSKKLVSDSPPGVDDVLPLVAVDGMGRVHVVWYDRRDDVGCGGGTRTFWTRSNDGGNSFAPGASLSSASSEWLKEFYENSNIGDRPGLAMSGGPAT
jgi:hypothetical protein